MPSASFGSAGAALGAYGSALKGMANKAAAPKTPLNSGSGINMSARTYRKMMNTKVEAYRQVASIDTAERGTRIGQSTQAMKDLKGAGFHTIDHDTPDVRIKGDASVTMQQSTSTSKDGSSSTTQSYSGSAPDRAYNPHPDVHGHPGDGHVTVHGYSGDAQANPGAHTVIALPPSAIRSASTPRALEGGKATVMGNQSGSRPAGAAAKPMFKAGDTGVVKAGSFMDQPEKAQPEIPAKLRNPGAIPMNSSATKGKMKGPQLMQSESGKLTESGWNAKLSAQEGAELAKRKAKMKKDD